MKQPSRSRLRRACVAAAAVSVLTAPVLAGAAYGAPPTVAAAAPSPSPDGTGTGTGTGVFRELTPAVAAQLDAAIRRTMTETRTPGVIVGVWTPDKGSYVKAFGVADKATGAPMSTGLYMRIGSETKTFTVTALLRLVDQGKLKLDDTIDRYVSGVPNGDRITLRQLAGMRSGLYNYADDPAFNRWLDTLPTEPIPPQRLLEYAFAHPVQFEPGAKFEYSNTNIILLGLAMEKATGKPFAQVLKEQVLRPAGLRHTSFPATGTEFPKPHAQGYTEQTTSGKTEDSTYITPSWGWSAGAIISDLQDLRSWARTLATGTLLTPATQQARLEMQPIGKPGASYGLGIFDVQGWIGHDGSIPGFESLVVYLPQARATMVVLLNTDVLTAGREPTAFFGQAVTGIVSPAHEYPGHESLLHPR